MKKPRQGEHRVHAFVDGQMTGREKARFLDEIESDAELWDSACELRRLKEYVSVAFDEVPPPPQRGPGRHAGPLRLGAAAMFLLGLGFLLGRVTMEQPLQPMVAEQASETARPAAGPAAGSYRVVLHIDEADRHKFMETLDRAEELMGQTGTHLVEVVANAGGLELLRSDTSPFVARLRQMAAHYPNLRFVACSNTLQRLHEQGIQTVIFEEADVAPSAVQHVVRRLQEGWVYVKV